MIRYRFTEEQIAALLEIKWWDWTAGPRALPLGRDIDAFVDYARAPRAGQLQMGLAVFPFG